MVMVSGLVCHSRSGQAIPVSLSGLASFPGRLGFLEVLLSIKANLIGRQHPGLCLLGL